MWIKMKKSRESCRWLSPGGRGPPTGWPSCFTSHPLVTLSRTELHALNQLSSAVRLEDHNMSTESVCVLSVEAGLVWVKPLCNYPWELSFNGCWNIPVNSFGNDVWEIWFFPLFLLTNSFFFFFFFSCEVTSGGTVYSIRRKKKQLTKQTSHSKEIFHACNEKKHVGFFFPDDLSDIIFPFFQSMLKPADQRYENLMLPRVFDFFLLFLTLKIKNQIDGFQL